MKKLSFLVLAVAGMLFAACSSDKDAAENGPQSNVRPEGYMALNINLPTTPVMRAANDDFNDGLNSEYKVSDCALLLFQGTNEANATLINAQAILLPFDEEVADVDNDNITTSYLATAKVKGYEKTEGNKLFALAVLNYKNVMSIEASGMPTIAGTTLTDESTLANIRALETNADLTSRTGAKDYFFMTNAVLSTAQGGEVEDAPTATAVFQLAEMNPNKIKETEQEAKNDPAGEIIVERAVAKATLTVEPTTLGTALGSLAIESTEWTIDNMESKSYVARNPGDLSYIDYTSAAFTDGNYRFVGNVTTKDATSKGSAGDAYRTYWCIDPHYSSPATGMVAASSFTTTGSTPLYCYENTFDVSNQSYRNTTRAIIKVTLTSDAEFWTVNGSTTRYTDVDNATSYIVDNIVNKTEVLEAFKNGLNSGKSWTVDKNSFAITYERDATTGQYKVKTLALSDTVKNQIDETDTPTKTFKKSFTTDIASVLSAAITTANKEVVVRDYKDGVIYYEARFKHFAGDGAADLAPWNTKATWEDPAPSAGDTSDSYPGASAAQNYLGRYGMVRNNWYDVTVTAFNNFGYPTDPSGQVTNEDFDDPDTPDDNIQEYISARIHVLSWAKRTQGWSF